METLDEGELPRPKSTSHRITVMIGINIILMLLVSLLINQSQQDDNLSKALMLAGLITLHFLICVIVGAGVLILRPAKRTTGIGLILSAVIVALLGFGVCVAQYS